MQSGPLCASGARGYQASHNATQGTSKPQFSPARLTLARSTRNRGPVLDGPQFQAITCYSNAFIRTACFTPTRTAVFTPTGAARFRPTTAARFTPTRAARFTPTRGCRFQVPFTGLPPTESGLGRSFTAGTWPPLISREPVSTGFLFLTRIRSDRSWVSATAIPVTSLSPPWNQQHAPQNTPKSLTRSATLGAGYVVPGSMGRKTVENPAKPCHIVPNLCFSFEPRHERFAFNDYRSPLGGEDRRKRLSLLGLPHLRKARLFRVSREYNESNSAAVEIAVSGRPP